MKSLWKHLADLFVEERKVQGSLSAALRLTSAIAALWFRRQHRALFALEVFRDYIATSDNRDALFHLILLCVQRYRSYPLKPS